MLGREYRPHSKGRLREFRALSQAFWPMVERFFRQGEERGTIVPNDRKTEEASCRRTPRAIPVCTDHTTTGLLKPRHHGCEGRSVRRNVGLNRFHKGIPNLNLPRAPRNSGLTRSLRLRVTFRWAGDREGNTPSEPSSPCPPVPVKGGRLAESHP